MKKRRVWLKHPHLSSWGHKSGVFTACSASLGPWCFGSPHRDSCSSSSSRRGGGTPRIDSPACCCNTHRSLCCACHSSSSRSQAFRPLSPPENRRAPLLRGGVCLESPGTASPGCLQPLPAPGMEEEERMHQSRDLNYGLPILPRRKQHSTYSLG